MANQIGRRVRGLVDWARARQQQVGDRVHADGDAFAIAHGWAISSGTGWLGFGLRQYRDPRFDLLPQVEERSDPSCRHGLRQAASTADAGRALR